MSDHILAIIQARMSSSRLPGKVLQDVAGKPIIHHMLDRVQNAKSLDGIVVATTTDPSDDVLENFCKQLAVPCFRGNLPDVLDRCYQAATNFQADVIVRLTADCPLIDPEVLDLTMAVFLGQSLLNVMPIPSQLPGNHSPVTIPFDFAANRLPPPWKRTLPIGLDVEVCSFESLQHAWKAAHETYQREHVMPYLYEGVSFEASSPSQHQGWYIDSGVTPRGFRIGLLNHIPDYGSLRWTVDTPADLDFVRQVYARFEHQPGFGWKDIINLLEKEPGLASINADVKHKSAFDIDQRTEGH
jgi:spore coat polysaccharide biosynthesis protein SpsF